MEFEATTKTVEDAAKALDVDPDRIIKSLLFVDEEGRLFIAIMTGDKEVDKEKLVDILRSSKVRLAKPDLVRALTGYGVGGLPSVGHARQGDIRYIIDEEVMRLNTVYGGGGTNRCLLRIDPRDIKKLTNAEIHRISR